MFGAVYRIAIVVTALALAATSLLAQSEFSEGTQLVVRGPTRGDKLNLRSKASASSKVLHKLADGTIGLVATGRTRMNGPDKWVEVRMDGQIGWVHARYVRAAPEQETARNGAKSVGRPDKSKPENKQNALNTTVLLKSGAKLQVGGIDTSGKLNMRAFANAKTELVALVPADAIEDLTVTGRIRETDTATWVEVEYGSKRGWVNARLIEEASAQPDANVVRDESRAVETEAKPPANAQAIADCDSEDPKRRLRGCTILLKKTELSGQMRAIAYSRRSDSHVLSGDLDHAIEDRQAALKLEPNSQSAKRRAAKALRMRGNRHQQEGNLDAALHDYAEAIRLDPANVNAIAGRASVYIHRDDLDSAISDLVTAYELRSESETYKELLTDLYAKRAKGAMAKKNYDAAIDDYGKAIDLSQTTTLHYYHRALALTAKSDHSRAMPDLTEAIRLDDSLLDARRLRAQSAIALQRYGDAVGDLDVVLKRQPKNVAAWLARALAWESHGNADIALNDYRAALRLDPRSKSAKAGVRRLERAAADEKALRDVPETAKKLLSKVQPFGPTRWSHNGSIMKLVANGTRRRFYYQRPRRGLRGNGVRRGTLLFDGRRRGFTYSGTARIFTRRCGTKKYAVSGTVADNEESVTLIGKAPILDSSCSVKGYRDDYLYFELVKPGKERVGIGLE